MDQAVQRMLSGLAVTVLLGFIYTQRQAGDRFRDHSDTGIHRGKLDRCLSIDRLAGTAGAEVEGRSGTDAVLRLIPSTEQRGEGVFHAGFTPFQWLLVALHGIVGLGSSARIS